MIISISSDAEDVLIDGYWFYERQHPGLGDYFRSCLIADIESLALSLAAAPRPPGTDQWLGPNVRRRRRGESRRRHFQPHRWPGRHVGGPREHPSGHGAISAARGHQALRRWGNSLGIRLPAAIAREARLQEDQAVELSVVEGGVLIRPVQPRLSLAERLAAYEPMAGEPTEAMAFPPLGAEVVE